MTSDEEAGLVANIRGGSNKAFQDLVHTYQHRLTALGMRFFKNLSDTEDFVQDVFLKLFSKINSFRGEARFSTWCTRVAYNVAINTVNRRKEQESLNAEALSGQDPGPEEKEVQKMTERALRKGITELPEHYAKTVDLCFFHNLPYKEISDIMAIPVNTVKSQVFRAKKMLKEKMGDYYE
jgi:RNA polymerase sigma-70 factor (ECF subfamily)